MFFATHTVRGENMTEDKAPLLQLTYEEFVAVL
jgi:hypothetical protein